MNSRRKWVLGGVFSWFLIDLLLVVFFGEWYVNLLIDQYHRL